MQTIFKLFFVCLCCFALTLLSGCGGDGSSAKAVSSFTPAEQAEVDKYIREQGRDALLRYLFDERKKNTDEKLVRKYVKYFVSQGANVNASIEDWVHGGYAIPITVENPRII